DFNHGTPGDKPQLSEKQTSFLDDVRGVVAEFLGIKSEPPQESTEQLLEKEKQAVEAATLESNVDEQVRQMLDQQAARDTGVAYVLSGGVWPEDPATGVPDWAYMSEEGRNTVRDVALYRDMAREAIELRDAAETLQDSMPDEAEKAGRQYDEIVEQLLQLESELNLTDREKQALIAMIDVRDVDGTDADDDDATGQVNEEAQAEEEEPLNEGAGAESDDEKETLSPVKKGERKEEKEDAKKDKGKEREELPRVREGEEALPKGVEPSTWEKAEKRAQELGYTLPKPGSKKAPEPVPPVEKQDQPPRELQEGEYPPLPEGVQESSWERAQQRMAELNAARESVTAEDKELEQRLRGVGKSGAELEVGVPAASSEEALKSLAEAPAPPAEAGTAEAVAAAEQVPVEDQGAAFDASLARVIRDLFPEPPQLHARGHLTHEQAQINIARVDGWLKQNHHNAEALIAAAMPQANSTASFAALKQPKLEETLAQLDKTEAILKSAVEQGEGQLKMSWEEFKQSSDQVYQRMVSIPGTETQRDNILYQTYERALKPVRDYASSNFAHMLTLASNELRNNDAAVTNSLLALTHKTNREWQRVSQASAAHTHKKLGKLEHQTERVFEAQNKTARVVNKVTKHLRMGGVAPEGDESEPSEAEQKLHQTANHLNQQLSQFFTDKLKHTEDTINALAEKAVKQAADVSGAILTDVPEEVQQAVMDAEKKALIFTAQATAVQNVVAPLRKVKSVSERREAEKIEPKSRFFKPGAGWLRAKHLDRKQSTDKVRRAKAVNKARVLPESFGMKYKQPSTRVRRERMTPEEEERVTLGL
ncbi:hypothetical protein, partial [Yaravirus sp. 'brasiliensis']